MVNSVALPFTGLAIKEVTDVNLNIIGRENPPTTNADDLQLTVRGNKGSGISYYALTAFALENNWRTFFNGLFECAIGVS